MVAVALHERPHVGDELGLIGEKAIFVHHDNADPVVNLEHALIRWVMRGAPAVSTHGTGRLSAEKIDPFRHGHAYHRKIVVVAEAPNLNVKNPESAERTLND